MWEIHLQNPKYSEVTSQQYVITDLTLVEFYYTLLRTYNEQTAEYWLKRLRPYVIPLDLDTLIKAAQFRHRNKSKNLSMYDCVGYVFSIQNNHEFVTGDKEFENMPGVLFIRK